MVLSDLLFQPANDNKVSLGHLPVVRAQQGKLGRRAAGGISIATNGIV